MTEYVCECNIPDVEVSKGHVGNWYVHIVYCGRCAVKLDVTATNQAVVDGATEPSEEDIPLMGRLVE